MRRFRLILNPPASPAMNMAIDEAIALAVMAGHVPPTLRLYGWEGPSVSIGRFQPADELDLGYCRENAIEIVRRPTGGRAVLHSPHELTYSFSGSSYGASVLFGKSLRETYDALSGAFLIAFEILGLHALSSSKSAHRLLAHNPVCFSSASIGEISVSGKKIIGSAQRRWPDGFLQQGSIPLMLDREAASLVFMREAEELDAKMAGLSEIRQDITLETLSAAVCGGFCRAFDAELVTSPLSSSEVDLAQALALEKYQSLQPARKQGYQMHRQQYQRPAYPSR